MNAKVSVIRNESPNCGRDRSKSGKTFRFAGLPGWAIGKTFFVTAEYGNSVILTTFRLDSHRCSPDQVRVKKARETTKNYDPDRFMPADGVSVVRTIPGRPVKCPMLTDGESYIVIDLTPLLLESNRMPSR